ncbi:hypothetical protein PI125_g24484 [Phytophthora idaei]|nr:hypothetical protein PI125_g24484 [Phytophthora idaei]
MYLAVVCVATNFSASTFDLLALISGVSGLLKPLRANSCPPSKNLEHSGFPGHITPQNRAVLALLKEVKEPLRPWIQVDELELLRVHRTIPGERSTGGVEPILVLRDLVEY